MAPAAATASLWESSSCSNNNNNKIVCVMDSSGLLGAALVNRLLQRGYIVHAAFNNRTDEMQRMKIKSRENSKLRVFHSDPLDYHSIMDALSGGCSALFYSFELPPEHPTYDELTSELEVRAAHNVLEACAQTETIEKIVFTSSATAIVWMDLDHQYHRSSNFDERSWSDINFCKKFKLWHGLSKTVAEKAAWALAMDRGVNMVSINAGLLMHPKLSTKDPYLSGAAEMFKGGIFVAVDLNFLVDAHLCAFEDPSSYGRYLCFNHLINCGNDVVKLAKMLLPSSSPHGEYYGMEDDTVYQKRISNAKLSKLMIDYDGRVQLQ